MNTESDRIAELERQLEAQRLLSKVHLPPKADCGRCVELERQLAELRQPTAQQVEAAAMLDWLEMMANKPEGLLLHDGGDFTGRCGLGLRRIGRSLRQACRQAMQAGKEKEHGN